MNHSTRILALLLFAACTGIASDANRPPSGAHNSFASPTVLFYANQSLIGIALDRADSSTATVTNVDKTGPVIRTPVSPSILWPPNGKIVPVEVSGTITDDGSGVDPDKVSYSVSDEYGRIQPKGHIVLGSGGAYAFTIRPEARRLGGDRDGRHYVVRINATDRAGNSSQASITILVPPGRLR